MQAAKHIQSPPRGTKRAGNAMHRLLEAIDGLMFPGGEVQEMRQVTELSHLLGQRYNHATIDGALRFTLFSFFLQVPVETRLVKALLRRPGNVLTAADAALLVHYALTKSMKCDAASKK